MLLLTILSIQQKKLQDLQFKGTALAGSNLTVKLAENLFQEIVGDDTGQWTADFRLTNSDLTNAQKTIIQSLSYPITISAEAKSLGGSTYTDNKKVELNEQVSTISISSTGGGADNM